MSADDLKRTPEPSLVNALFLVGTALLLAGCARPLDFDLAIKDVSVVDVVTGEILANRHLGIRDGKIAYVGSGPATAETVLSGDGRWAIPGLWDMHVHISDPSFFSLFVTNGVVGVRDMGGAAPMATGGCESIEPDTLRSWRAEIRNGNLLGPDIVMAGPVLSGTGSASTLDVTSPEKARDAVSTAVSAGADFVKVYEDIPLDAFVALADETKERGLHFAGHVSEETLRIVDAIRFGQRSIEHVRSHLLLCFADTTDQLEQLFESDRWDIEDRIWAAPHVESCPEVWREFRTSDTWLTPTLAVQETLQTASVTGFEYDQRRSTLPESIRDAAATRSQELRKRTSGEIADAENWNRFIHRLVARANREGVKLLAGSDAACEGTIPGFSLHRELELMASAGLSSLEALQAATLEPARYLERDDELGRLEVGFEADIVLLEGNPLEDIGNTRLIYAVILNGEAVSVSTESH